MSLKHSYCNRLRASDYRKLFSDLGYAIDHEETEVDAQSLKALQEGGMVVDPTFSGLARPLPPPG